MYYSVFINLNSIFFNDLTISKSHVIIIIIIIK